MAVESTPERSFSDLLSNSRAASATTGWVRVGRPVLSCQRRVPSASCAVCSIASMVCSILRVGSERNEATPCSVFLCSVLCFWWLVLFCCVCLVFVLWSLCLWLSG